MKQWKKAAIVTAAAGMMLMSGFSTGLSAAGEPEEITEYAEMESITLGAINIGSVNMSLIGAIPLDGEGIIIDEIPDQAYAGRPVEPDVRITYKRKLYFGDFVLLLEKDIDYTLKYSNNDKPGTATVTVTGTGAKTNTYGNEEGWTGSVTKTFKITGQESSSGTEPSESSAGTEPSESSAGTEPSESSAGTEPSTSAPIGTTVEAGSGASLALYQVTGKDTVTYVKCRAAKNAKAVQVPPTVTINKAVYRVTVVAASACAGRGKVTKVTIGANVEAIGGKAFSKCKKLKILTVKSKLLTPAGCRKCLKGSSVTAVKVPKAKKKAYKKIFKKSVCGKSVKLK